MSNKFEDLEKIDNWIIIIRSSLREKKYDVAIDSTNKLSEHIQNLKDEIGFTAMYEGCWDE